MADFLTYQLPFEYDPEATCPQFQKFLNEVLPDEDCQMILLEYLGYLFIKPSVLRLDKILVNKGSGANGKSVFFEIVNALLGGPVNVCSCSIEDITLDKNYSRSMLENKLVNYSTELSSKLDTNILKVLASLEPLNARAIYRGPFTMTNYAKQIVNCNDLPRVTDQTHGYFRRFLIVPFEVTIPEDAQDKDLSKKIIANELSGIFNLVLDGLNRLLVQKRFTDSPVVRMQTEAYNQQSDLVSTFMEEEGYEKSLTEYVTRTSLFNHFRMYAIQNNEMPMSSKKFCERLKSFGYIFDRKNVGTIVFTYRRAIPGTDLENPNQ